MTPCRAAELGRAAAQVHGLLVRCRAVAVLRSRKCAVVFDQQAGGKMAVLRGRRRRWMTGSEEAISAEGRSGGGAGDRPLRPGGPVRGSWIGRVPGSFGAGPCSVGIHGSHPCRAGQHHQLLFERDSDPSSVYFTDHSRRMVVLRVYGGTGRINRLAWQRGWSEWR